MANLNIDTNILFDPTPISQITTKAVTVENTTGTPITITLAITKPFSIYYVTEYVHTYTVIVPSTSTIQINLYFAPTKITNYKSTFILTDTTNNQTYFIAAEGDGTIPYTRLYTDIENNITEFEQYIDPSEEEISSQYVDLDMMFSNNSRTGDVTKKLNENAVIQSIKNIILGKSLWYNRNTNIKALVFENMNAPFYEYRIQEALKEKVLTYEPRVSLVEVTLANINEDDKSIKLDISFTLKNDTTIVYNFPLFIRVR
jgi:phage baseplate assembly protein W